MKRLLSICLSAFLIYGLGLILAKNGGASINTFMLLVLLVFQLETHLDIRAIKDRL